MPATTARYYDRIAYELRTEGRDYAAIAAHSGITANQAYGAVRRYAARIGQPVPTRTHLRANRQAGFAASLNRGIQTGTATAVPVAPAQLTTRKFGVEIECFGLTAIAATNALQAAGLSVRNEGYNHTTRSYWKVITDSSVNSSGTGSGSGLEVVSPPLSGETGYADLRAAMKALTDAGARIDGTCGLHVHHDCNDLTGNEAAELVLLWSGHRSTLDALVAPSRRMNGVRSNWCQPFRNGEAVAISNRFRAFGAGTVPTSGRSQFGQYDRYRSLNVTSFPRYGTIEVRQHQGTLNGTKAVAWVQMGQALIQAARAGATLRTGADFLSDLTAHGLATEAAAFLTERLDTLA